MAIGIAAMIALDRSEAAAVRRAFEQHPVASRSEDPVLRVQLAGPRTRAWIRRMATSALRDDRETLLPRPMLDVTTILDPRTRFDRAGLEALTDERALEHFRREARDLGDIAISRIEPGRNRARARLDAPRGFFGEEEHFIRFEDRWAFEPYVLQNGIMEHAGFGLPETERARILEQTMDATPGFDPALWNGPRSLPSNPARPRRTDP
jgi:hypothetical protein